VQWGADGLIAQGGEAGGLSADRTLRTMLFGLGLPAPHRVIANAATQRWCNADGAAKAISRLVNGGSAFLAKLPATTSVLRMQTPRLPLFSPNHRNARFGR
jgi:nitronate monooxygenase